jgi:hypothetical protein
VVSEADPAELGPKSADNPAVFGQVVAGGRQGLGLIEDRSEIVIDGGSHRRDMCVVLAA